MLPLPAPRLRRAYCLAAALACGAIGLGSVLAPAAVAPLFPWALAPLHARCFGVMHLAWAVGFWSARRALDPAAARIPLLGIAAWCMGTLAALPWPAASLGASVGASAALFTTTTAVWAAVLVAGAAGAWALLRADHELQAPAERPGPALLVVAALLWLAAGALAFTPETAARLWPWKLPPALAGAYAGPFFSFGLAAALAAMERRRGARAPAVHTLGALGLGVLGASLWHAKLFNWQGPAAWLWFAAFAALAVLAWWHTRWRLPWRLRWR